MATTGNTPPEKKLARFLGWFSLALGVPQVLAPRAVNRTIGVEDDSGSRAWQRVVGMRELGAAAGILPTGRPPAGWLWARVAGDIEDLALLSYALANKSKRRGRTIAATASVVGVTAADVYTAIRLDQQTPEIAKQIRVATTIRRDRGEVHDRWNHFQGELDWSKDASLRFVDAPGDRGTEIHVVIEPGGPLARIRGSIKAESVQHDLRRFKQIVETGQVVRSEGTPDGPSAVRLIKQRPAQPLQATGAGRSGS
jgi:hypothetical protein